MVQVANFFHGKSIFITGGTGYLGKALIAKLLYSCPGIENIFVLLRPKNNTNLDTRLNSILKNDALSVLREKYPERLRKVAPIQGDITLDNLGISESDESIIRKKVSIIFHVAAAVKFKERLTLVMKINVEGTRKVIELSKRLEKLDVLVHCSTAFSNADKEVIDEKVHRHPKTIKDAYDFIQKYGDGHEKSLKCLLDGHHNTYTFSKALAETLVCDTHDHVPVVIVRPSIVTPTYKEPVPGWVDNWNGPTGYLHELSMGTIHAVAGHESIVADIIPADFSANLLIIAAAKGVRSQQVAVYNNCSGDTNPITWGELTHQFVNEINKLKKAELPVYILFFRHMFPMRIAQLLLEDFPVYLHRFVCFILGSKFNLKKRLRHFRLSQDALIPFSSTSWIMKSQKTTDLISSLSPEDQNEFLCDPKAIDYPAYLKNYAMGVQKYLLNADKRKNNVEDDSRNHVFSNDMNE